MPTRDVSDVVGPSLHTTRRNLPHWQAGGSTYFITFHLKGSLDSPPHGSAGFQPAQAPTGASPSHRATAAQPALAPKERQIVKESILHWQGVKWTVHALTVMPDHTHILATSQEKSEGEWHSLSDILHSVKRHSARQINHLRGRRGSLWQPESFDRIVRDEEEFDEKANYILSNAVNAGLVEDGWLYDGFWCEGVQGTP